MKFSLQNTKKFLIGCVSAFLVAIVILCIFGFNLGAELRGYTEVKVNTGIYDTLEDNYKKESKKEVLDVLKENGAKVISTNLEDTYFNTKLVVMVKNISKDRAENIAFANTLKEALENHYNDDLIVVEVSTVSGVMTDSSVIRLTYTLLISMIVVMIYALFRIRLLNTICVICSTFVTEMILVTLMILTRVQVNLYSLGIVIATGILSLIVNIFCFAELRNSRTQLTQEIAERVDYKDTLSILSLLLIVSLLVPMIFGSSIIRGYVITVIYSLVSVWLTNKFVAGQLSFYISDTTVSNTKPIEETTETSEEKVIE